MFGIHGKGELGEATSIKSRGRVLGISLLSLNTWAVILRRKANLNALLYNR